MAGIMSASMNKAGYPKGSAKPWLKFVIAPIFIIVLRSCDMYKDHLLDKLEYRERVRNHMKGLLPKGARIGAVYMGIDPTGREIIIQFLSETGEELIGSGIIPWDGSPARFTIKHLN
jgi:hypothetical protein